VANENATHRYLSEDAPDGYSVEDICGDDWLDGWEQAVRSLASWRITAVGTRPLDYAARDLIVGSLLRDRRMWPLHKLSAEPEYWIYERTNDLPEELQHIARQVLIVQFLHALRLYRFHELAAHEEDDYTVKVIERLRNCVPYGVLVQPTNGVREPRARTCNRPRQCPFCFARNVVGLYKRFEPSTWNHPERYWVLGRLTISDETLPDIPDLSNHGESCATIRRVLTGILARQARALGATGGISTFLMGPDQYAKWDNGELSDEPSFGFAYHASVLATVQQRTVALDALIESNPEPLYEQCPPLRSGDEEIQAEWKIRSATDPTALRLMLFGTGPACRKAIDDGGDCGAFFLPSWPLSSYDQWRRHLVQANGLRMHARWGSL